MNNQQTSRTWIEVSLPNIRHNVIAIRNSLPETTRFLGVVKADAYGHGAIPVAKEILKAGGSYLAVACLSEAIQLREAGIDAPILILGITPPYEAKTLAAYRITQAVSSVAYAKELSQNLDSPLTVHMKLDTGMSRTGFRWNDEAAIASARACGNLVFEGIFTHFAVSDVPNDPSREFTEEQHNRFLNGVRLAEAHGGAISIHHCANSGATLTGGKFAHNMVRPGIITYGLYPDADRGNIELRPAMALRSRIYAITDHFPGDTVSYGRTFTVSRPTRLAVVPAGYADGLPRIASNSLSAIINGKRCPQVGRVCMDMCMVDITDLPEAKPGDVVTLMGRDGSEEIPAEELASLAQTINYEIVCGFTPRVPRIYFE